MLRVEVLTRRWTWRQAAGTQTQPETPAVFFNLVGLPPITDDQVRAAMSDIKDLMREHTGGQVNESVVLSVERPSFG